jgi:predicted transposase YbfD/YdcC
VKKWDADFVREQLGIPGCRALLRLDKAVRRGGKLHSYETRYFVSSLDPSVVSAAEFQDYILRHWEVENCLHGQKDKEYAEDKHVLGRDSWGEAWTILTNMAVSLTHLLHRGERTLREVREKCRLDPRPTARKLGWKT